MKTIRINIISGCLILAFAAAGYCADFKFVVWGDSQLENQQTFQRIVSETELLKPELVLHVGDMIIGYTSDPEKVRDQWKRFKQQIAPLSCPFYPAPGNHDLTTTITEPIFCEVWGREKTYYSFDHKNSHFIILNTDLHTQIDSLPEEELEWLKDDLERHKNARNIFLAFHSPLYVAVEYDWKPIHALLKKYPVRAVFTGHSHVYDHGVVDGIHYFCLNSSGTMPFSNHLAGFSHHFLHVTVEDGDPNPTYAVVTDGRIYSADSVTSGEFNRAMKYLERDQTLIIPDASTTPTNFLLKVPIQNRSDEARAFTLRWETNDFRWRFEPMGREVSLAPGELLSIEFHISGPQGKFRRDDLPRLRAESPYRNGAGWDTTLSHHFRLFSPPETTARRLTGTITLDGRLDDPVWKDAAAIRRMVVDYQDSPATETTVTKILYDSSNLYVGIQGEEPNPAGLTAKAGGAIPLVFSDDDFELYLDPNRSLKTFYRLAVNSKGTVLCSSPDGYFKFHFDVKTYVGPNFWGAEFRIPFSELKSKPPQSGDVWGLNVRRYRQQSKPVQSEWSKMQNFPAQPPYFGMLRFRE